MKRLLGFACIGIFLIGSAVVWAQEKPHGELKERKKGVHSGNQIRTTFYNTGFIGRKTNSPSDYGVEFPINSGHTYVGDACLYVGSEVRDVHGALKHIVVTPDGPEAGARTGQRGPGGEWYTWMPLPGYTNPDSNSVAMSQLKWSWPAFWPDKMDDPTDPGWPGSWDGYFGKNIFNADQESYFVMDDYNDREFAFYPDSTDTTRRGLGMKVTARGMQWSNALVQDALFWLYDIKNIGTTSYDKMVFGMMIGNMIGHSEKGNGDYGDDCAAYDLDNDLAYSWDFDNTGDTGWTPVAWLGYAFLESPGNPYDGIDNDDDGKNGPGPTITTAMFDPFSVAAGDQIVVIDYKTYKRTVTTMPEDSLVILFGGKKHVFKPGQMLEEIPNNNFDDNLNGLIDENDGSKIEIAPGTYQQNYLYVGLKYKDYFTGEGLDNPMIDERRDDGIDNDGNWDPLTDDVGLDGVPNTGDFGEGDGKPTSGWQPGPNGVLVDTHEPGEPHIDKTDINESDMIGLTSFFNFKPFSFVPLSDDEKIWKYSTPGYLNAALQNADADFMFASGYFPIKPQQIERFSMAMVFGWNHDELLRNTKWVKEAYANNYNFAKAPYIPTLTAVPGDNKVTLYWDDKAEISKDPISGYDFEGYRIYRSSDPSFNDPIAITDGYGSKTYLKPMAQFDLVDAYQGFAQVPVNGVEFFLGKNTGLRHSFVDTTAKNGFTYYYAVTAYDHGDPENGIPPTETSKSIVIGASGLVESKGTNVAVVRPEAPVAGYEGPSADEKELTPSPGTKGTGHVYVKVIDPTRLKNDNTYKIVFIGKSSGVVPKASNYAVINITDPTKPDTLLNVPFLVVSTDGDTIIDRTRDLEGRDFFDGFQLTVKNSWKIRKIKKYSGWFPYPDTAYVVTFAPFEFSGIQPRGVDYPRDYELIFSDDLIGKSDPLTVYQNGVPIQIPSQPTNFIALDPNTGDTLHYAFIDNPFRPSFIPAGYFSNLDNVVFFEQKPDTTFITWSLSITGNDSTAHLPGTGDTLRIRTSKPFQPGDSFVLTSQAPKVNYRVAATDSSLDRIKVVPNPYIVGATWEPPNPYSSGRGPRELHFTHLPPQATIRIYTVRGDLVATLEHNSSIYDGTAIWNMLTKDNLDIAYGVYIYHIEARDASGKAIGEKIGKFAVIK
ncbi:MAG: hypothetical protein GXO76_15300 [Calditrichaeota bacterium]|nr:hypothetical protein [Calditrichota bacterium]